MNTLRSDSRLLEIIESLRSGRWALADYINSVCDRIDSVDPKIEALLPESGRRSRLLGEASDLLQRFPDEKQRPALFGILVGVKDIFRVDGFPTRAGSKLPAELFAGPEATSVSMLRRQGALILGKTITTEFAYAEPGPTRNPNNLDHTPGGSSSGSAAAVASGLCPLAFGTQTIGSVIRPASFCGIIGFKPTCNRIPKDGVIPFSITVDHVGIFTQDVGGMRLAASLLCEGWKEIDPQERGRPRPVLAVPDGPYLEQALSEALTAFEDQLQALKRSGYEIKRIPAFENISDINVRHRKLIAAEISEVHAQWFDEYETLYRPRTAEIIKDGRQVDPETVSKGRKGCEALRGELERIMNDQKIDIWVSPSATGTAPEGIDSTGDPVMNLPWTHAGMPTVTIPSGFDEKGLPYGLQFTARFMEDEMLLHWGRGLEDILGEE